MSEIIPKRGYMGWFYNLKIRSKMILSFTVVIILVAIMSVFVIVRLNGVSESYTTVLDYSVVAAGAIMEFEADLNDLRRATATMSTFAGLEDSDAMIERFASEARSSYEDALDQLQLYDELVHTNPNLKDDAAGRASRLGQSDQLRQLINTYWKDAAEPIITAARDYDHEGTVAILFATASLTAELSELSDVMLTAVEASRDGQKAGAQKNASDTQWILIGIAAGVLVISLVIALVVASAVSTPIKRLVDVADNVANGNLNVNINTSSRDETGQLSGSISNMIAAVNRIISDLNEIINEVNVNGDVEFRADPSRFNGAYREVAEGVNSLVNGLIGDTMHALDALDAFGNGDFNINVPKLPGKKVVLNKAIDSMKENLKTINTDVMTLVQAAIDGKLSTRVDVNKYEGDWASLMNGLNSLCEEIIGPIYEAAEVLENVSVGKFDVTVKGDYKGDFLTLKNSINSTVTNVSGYIEEISDVLHEMSNNNFDQTIHREYVGSYVNIKNALNEILDTFNRVIGEITTAGGNVSAGAKSISESSMTLATGASEQAASVEELNATVQVINESTASNTENARNAETFSNHAKSNAARGDEDMKNMLSSMEGIKDSSNKITKIINVIQDIAFQTNLLALNAAVEAARAGEHGKGFAVVAEEVRTLAGRSQGAAKETAELIDESINRVDEGSKTAQLTAEALKTIVEDVSKIAEIINRIATSSDEQSTAIKHVTEGLFQITEVVQNNSATSEESAAAAEQLSSQAELLHNLVSVFRLKK